MVEILLDIGCSAQSLSTCKIINLGFFSIENNVIFSIIKEYQYLTL